MAGEKFDEHLEKLKAKVENNRAILTQLRTELYDKMIPRDDLSKETNVKNLRKGLKSLLKKAEKTAWLEQLEKKEKQLEIVQNNLSNTERFVPLGVDSKEQVYWYFPCYKQLVVEKKSEDAEIIKWYAFQPEDVQGNIFLLKKFSIL